MATFTVASSRAQPGLPPPVARGWRWLYAAGLLSVAGGGAALGVAGARLLRRPAEAPAPAVAAARRPFVSVALRSTTPGARFRFEDGREVANPYVGLVPRDERPHAVWVEAPGHLPKKLSLAFADDVTVDDIVLVGLGGEPARAPEVRPGPRRSPDHGVLMPPRAPHR